MPNANIVLGGSGNSRNITVTAAFRKAGASTLTFNLSDGAVTVPVFITVTVGTARDETMNGTSGTDMMFGLGGKARVSKFASRRHGYMSSYRQFRWPLQQRQEFSSNAKVS